MDESRAAIKVSIVLPNFNHGKFLRESIQSVIAQTYEDWELIIVDNFSADESAEVVGEVLSDRRIRFVRFDNRGVIAASRNKGLSLARGELVAFLDADDKWSARKLEYSVREYRKGAHVSFHNMRVMDERSRRLVFSRLRGRTIGSNAFKSLVKFGNPIVNSSAVVEKQALGQVGFLDSSKDMIGSEDYNLWLKLAKHGVKFRYIPISLGTYRLHKGGVSRNDMSGAYLASIKPFTLPVDLEPRVKSIASYMRGRRAYLAGEYSEAKAHLESVLDGGAFQHKLRAMYMLIGIRLRK